jgi:hypothetical protein
MFAYSIIQQVHNYSPAASMHSICSVMQLDVSVTNGSRVVKFGEELPRTVALSNHLRKVPPLFCILFDRLFI